MELPYELFIGLRYLKAKRRSRFVSLNTFISVGGVTLGVAALIATLAVMTGFKEDLRDKILGTNSHIIINDRTSDTLQDYSMVLDRVMKKDHVIAAAPFIYHQVLLASQGTVYGIILRGVDPSRESTVTDIQNNMLQGNLRDLERLATEATPDSPSPPGTAVEGTGTELEYNVGYIVEVERVTTSLAPAGSGTREFTILPVE